jgi:hypothetical protein
LVIGFRRSRNYLPTGLVCLTLLLLRCKTRSFLGRVSMGQEYQPRTTMSIPFFAI